MELVVILFWLTPIVAVVWALFTLRRVRTAVELMHLKLEAIERLLQRQPPIQG
jgi:hypothetical protein